MRRVSVLFGVIAAMVCMSAGMALSQQPDGEARGRYIVVLEDAVQEPARVAGEISGRSNAEVGFVYRNALKGFSAAIPESRVDQVRSDSRVDYVERDGVMKTVAQTLPWGIERIEADNSSTRAGDGTGAVSNVNAYIIDTGIDTSHPDLNVVGHTNFANGPNRDCNGHGTHVAGTVAARDNASDVVGAAPGAPLTGVKVLSCSGSGSTSGVIRGVDWVTANAKKPAVANMSLGGGASQALDDAVKRSAAGGVFYALAAGNEGVNACTTSPARAGTSNGVTTTAATDSQNREASFSNFGTCVDVWAPGVGILSTKNGGGTTTFSGTSMASPHVGGAGALYLSIPTRAGASPATVEGAIKAAATVPGTSSKDGRQIQLLNVGGF